jgi:hypothetical protein
VGYRYDRPSSVDVGLPEVVANVVCESCQFLFTNSAPEHRLATLVQSFEVGAREWRTLGCGGGGRSPHKGESRANGQMGELRLIAQDTRV